MSSSSMATSLVSRTGPVSSPSSGQNTDSPVVRSPWMIAQLIALGPRWRGRIDGWYWMTPWVGISRTFSGTNSVTNAMTMRSGSSSAIPRATSSSLNDGGWRTVIDASRAASASGSGGLPSLSGAQ